MTDLALAERDLLYLSNKRVLLSNPGTILDDLFYNRINTTVSLSEATFSMGRLQISLSNSNFGSQSQVSIPNQSLLGNVYLRLVLANVPANTTLMRGWGISAIASISYLFGSSNVSQFQIPVHSIFSKIMMACETTEKRSEIMRLAGEEHLSAVAGTVEANILLPLPFSNSSGLFKKKPFDTDLLQNPITIQIAFARAENIFGGSGIFPTGFLSATIFVRQGMLANKDQGLKATLLRNPSMMYAYPFLHAANYTPAQFQGSISPNSPVSIPLLSFINADLVGITIGVIETSKITSNPGTGAMPAQFDYEDIQNVRIEFNGLIMYNTPGVLWKLVNMQSEIGSSFLHNSVIVPQVGAGPYTSNPKDTYIQVYDFSRTRALTYEGNFNNVWRIGNNVLTFFCNTLTANNYTLFATYFYNGIIEVQNAQTKIFFD